MRDGSKKSLYVPAFVLCIFMVLVVFASAVKAADNDLTGIATVDITELKDGTTDLLSGSDATVTYGDMLMVSMEWSIPDGPVLSVGQDYSYVLPAQIRFSQTSGDLLDDDNKPLGTYTISDNTILINYTDDDFCLRNSNRHGRLKFSGTITNDGNGGQTEGSMTITFPVEKNVTFNVQKPPLESKVEVTKEFKDIKDTPYYYDCYISFTSRGINTGVTLADEMWPGMSLYSKPELYSDPGYSVPLDTSRYTDSTEAPAEGQRFVNAVVGSMSNGETIYLKYRVHVDPAMYENASAQEKVGNMTNFYPYSYQGNVPNRATVTSNEDKTGKTVWADVRTFRAHFGKWTHDGYHDFANGKVGWQIALYSISGTGYQRGYVLDTLPKGMSLVEDSVQVKNTNIGQFMDNAVTISKRTLDSGDTEITFTFSQALIDHLTEDGGEAFIGYQTKVDSQLNDTVRYINRAEIFYDGVSKQSTGSDIDYKKPEELKKGGVYDGSTAPYANYTLNVNPAALDLDANPDTTTVTLEDQMSSSYDLKLSSVKINGKAPSSEEFTYDQGSRKMTFTLKDGVSYVITYSAAVNLVPGSMLTDENSGNSAKLIAGKDVVDEKVSTFKCEVQMSAGSSSSTTPLPVLNVIKHDKSDVTSVLEGAGFSLGKFDADSGKVVSSFTGTTDGNGSLSFARLERGTIYMLTETKAPSGYAVSSEPSFYVFLPSSGPSAVTYEGKTYQVNQIADGKISYDIYYPNTPFKATPTPALSVTPTTAPTSVPTSAPTTKPTTAPTAAPTSVPTAEPTVLPTKVPTIAPSSATAAPTKSPTKAPTLAPSGATTAPTSKPVVTTTAATPTPVGGVPGNAGDGNDTSDDGKDRDGISDDPVIVPAKTDNADPTATPAPTSTPTPTPTSAPKAGATTATGETVSLVRYGTLGGSIAIAGFLIGMAIVIRRERKHGDK